MREKLPHWHQGLVRVAQATETPVLVLSCETEREEEKGKRSQRKNWNSFFELKQSIWVLVNCFSRKKKNGPNTGRNCFRQVAVPLGHRLRIPMLDLDWCDSLLQLPVLYAVPMRLLQEHLGKALHCVGLHEVACLFLRRVFPEHRNHLFRGWDATGLDD